MTCPDCGADNADALLWTQGGTEVTAPVPVGAERRHITVFFADLSGYTAMLERLGPEEVQGIMNTVFSHATRVVEKYGGRIDKLQGDAVMAIFGDPVSHEDDAERAVRAVLELHAAVADYSPIVEQRLGQPVRMHTGINTGLVVTGSPEFDNAVGDAINVASRLEDLSQPGEILIGPETARLVESRFETSDHGAHELKGKVGRVPVTTVLGLAAARIEPSRRQARFVGRHEDLGILLEAVERMRDGESSVITVEGEAGVGKTRLLSEFEKRLPDGVQWLEGRAYAYGENIPYSPVIDLLSRAFGIEEDDSAGVIEAKLRAAVSGLVEDVDPTYEPLARLYGLDQVAAGSLDRETFQKRLLESALRIAEALASQAPTVLAFQDLHWADDSTIRLIQGLIDRLRSPAVVVANYRSGFRLEVEVPGRRELMLGELSPQQTGELLASLLEGSPPKELVDFIIDRTDGNPFFMEEIVNSLIETEALVDSAEGWVIKGPLEEVGLPTTIRGVIAARIDRLDEKRRRVLREASVVGREFLYEVVRRVTTVTDELEPSLHDLEAADLIREKAVEPDLEYLFKHALTQDVAYDGLLRSEREQLHARAAQAIEAQFEGRIEEVTETLAHHWRHSGVTDKAVQYLMAAGRKAMERFALKESRAHYESAYEMLVAQPESADRDKVIVELLLDWAFLAYYEASLHQLKHLLLEHQELVNRVGTKEQEGMWIAWLGLAYLTADGEMTKAIEALNEAVRLGREESNLEVIGYAQCWRTYALWFSGRFEEALLAGEEAYRIGQELVEHPYVWMKGALGLGVNQAMMGNYAEARRLSDELISYGERTRSSRAIAMGYLTKVSLSFGFDRVKEQKQFDMVRDYADPIYAHSVFPAHAFALLFADEFEEARAFAEDQYRRYHEDTHVRFLSSWFELVFGLLEAAEGNPNACLKRLDRLIVESERKDELLVVRFGEMLKAYLFAIVASRESSLREAVKNPSFTLRHGLTLRKEARRRLEHVSSHLEEWGIGGMRPLVELVYAQFLNHDGHLDDARTHLRKAIASGAVAGNTPWLREAQLLLAEWQQNR